jgi:hypothetical protein
MFDGVLASFSPLILPDERPSGEKGKQGKLMETTDSQRFQEKQ